MCIHTNENDYNHFELGRSITTQSLILKNVLLLYEMKKRGENENKHVYIPSSFWCVVVYAVREL
jgi:hypothetical protein